MFPTKTATIKIFNKNKIPIPDELNEMKSSKLVHPSKVSDENLKKAWLLNLTGVGLKSINKKYRHITPKNIMKNIQDFPFAAQMDIIWKPNKNIPRDDVPKIVQKFIGKEKVIVTGSWRRGKPFVGDIDILSLNPSKFKTHLINTSKKNKWIKIAEGKTKISLIYMYKYPVKIDVWFVYDKKTLPFMKLYSTGSFMLNIIMRTSAKRKSLKLNQYNLTTLDGNEIPLKTERDIFEYLDLDYLTPSNR